MAKSIVLCADDYGQAKAISQGILQLIQQKRLSATSCLVNTAAWAETSLWLLPFKNQIDIGLHFNLTEGEALSSGYIECYGKKFFSLPSLMGLSFLRRLNEQAIEAELNAQLDTFSETLNMLPDFIDGHQHIQQFPIIRTALMKVYHQRLRDKKPYLRLSKESIEFGDLGQPKKMIILLAGGVAFKKLLIKHKIPFNQSFAGIYHFSEAKHYRNRFMTFLKKTTHQGLIMCHPGLASNEPGDMIEEARYAEYQYFLSSDFIEDCQRYDVVIQPFFQGV